MYCLKCGKKISLGEEQCSECGTKISGNEYCGGFWGLVGEDNKIERNSKPCDPIKVVNESENEELRKTIKKDAFIKKKYRKKTQILSVFLIVLVAVCFAQIVFCSVTIKNYQNTKKENQNLYQQNQELIDSNDELSNQLKNLEKRYSYMENQKNMFEEEQSINGQ